jgi:adenine deaminase
LIKDNILNNELKNLIQNIPKAELHCHIESIWPEMVLKLAERNKMIPPFADVDSAVLAYKSISTLDDFLDAWKAAVSVVCTAEDYYDITMEFGRDAKRQNIIYREAMFTYAAAHQNRDIALETVIEGFSAGRKDVLKKYGVDIRFIAEIDRTISPEDSLAFVKSINKYRENLPITAIGLDCEEIGYPASIHKEAFNLARELGFNTTAHVSEDVGPESGWDTINKTKVDRFDHGVRSIEDPELVVWLAEHKTLLTVCPLSNLMVGTYPSLEKHPIMELINNGVKVCINSDDPPFIGSDLVETYIAVAETFSLNNQQVIQLVRNAFLYNFSGNEYISKVDDWLNHSF